MAVRGNHAAAGVEQRLLGVLEQLHDLADLADMRLLGRLVAAHLDLVRIGELVHLLLHVLGQVHQDRAGTARAGEIESLLDRRGQILDVLDQVVVLGARPGDADDVDFLERVIADERARHLPGDDDHRDGIRVRRGDAGYGIGGSGAGGD